MQRPNGLFWYGIKTIMGTHRWISSHSLFTTEVVNNVRLLLFWPAASLNTRLISATHGFRVLPVTAEPSGFPFPRRGAVPGWSVFQALVLISRRIVSVSENLWPKPLIFRALWLNRWKNVSGFRWLTEHIEREVHLVQASALLVRRPEGLTESDRVSIK